MPDPFTQDEGSLLLYLETRAVDHDCRIDHRHLNDDDRVILKRWVETGIVEYGRVASQRDPFGNVQPAQNYVRLSEEAWELAHRLRRERADRRWANRTWQTTQEKGETL